MKDIDHYPDVAHLWIKSAFDETTHPCQNLWHTERDVFSRSATDKPVFSARRRIRKVH